MLVSDVWSENAARFKRLMEINSDPPILYTLALNVLCSTFCLISYCGLSLRVTFYRNSA